jgi:hypothetical protein
MKTLTLVGIGLIAASLAGCRQGSPEPSPAPSAPDDGSAKSAAVPLVRNLVDFDYAALKLVDEIDCAADLGERMRHYPTAGASEIQEILGRTCRVLKVGDTARFMAFRIGQGKGLKAGAAYVLTVDYPEDVARAMFIQNRGCETGSGLATGQAVGDTVIGKYVNNNPESLRYPLAGEYRRWSQFFYLHDRFPEFDSLRGNKVRPMTPEEGFWVVISQTDLNNDPLSAGAAAAKIALYEVADPEAHFVTLNYPPAGLPRRHIFCREEMADGVVSVPHGADKPEERGFDDPNTWFEFKMRNMRFLGMNTFSKDLLEFGHNQGWDAGDPDWFVASSSPQRWRLMLETLAAKHPDLYVLPYYEYGGGTGAKAAGKKEIVRTLTNKQVYTHIAWLEKNAHLDILDPDALADAKRMLDATVVRHKDLVNFLGVWLRPRPTQMPISFSDANLALYAEETSVQVTREALAADQAKLDAYYAWWFGKRQAFLAALARHLRENGVNEQAIVLLTTDASEPGASLPGNVIVTDDVPAWQTAMATLPKKRTPVDYAQAVRDRLYAKVMLSPIGTTWGEWEWQHACPGPDPANHQGQDGTLVSYSFNRLYSVADPAALDAFRSGAGLALVRHYTLNENMMHDAQDKEIMGYFVSDVDRAGPYCMMAEARAMANGDPRYLGYLVGNSMARGFPRYVRAFNAAFLALPALPSRILPDAASDPEVVVREIPADAHGTYLAVVNTGLAPSKEVVLTLPAGKTLTDAVTGAKLALKDGKLPLAMYPGELRALRLQ